MLSLFATSFSPSFPPPLRPAYNVSVVSSSSSSSLFFPRQQMLHEKKQDTHIAVSLYDCVTDKIRRTQANNQQ